MIDLQYALPASRLKTRLACGGLVLLDITVVWVLLHAGKSLLFSQLAGFAVATALHLASPGNASRQSRSVNLGWGIAVQMLAAAIASLLLRCAVLALLVGRCEWQPQFAILFAAPAGLTVLLGSSSLILSRREPAERWRIFVAALTVYSCALRLLYAGCVDLLPEETYYWSYSRHLDIGYLDHPPVVAWLIRVSTAMLGQTEFAVRAGAILCGTLTSFFIYRLTRNVFGGAAALAALALTQALPFFFLAGLLMTPDSPLTACWAACLYFLERALAGEKSAAWWRAGLALGVGLISKYTILLLALSAVAYVLWDPRSRQWLRRYQPYLAVFCALLIFAPVLVWNSEHHWASFAFQTAGRLAEKTRFALPNLLGAVIILLSPIGALALVLEVARKDAQRDRGRRLLLLATLLPLAVFLLFSLRHQVKLDWTGAPLVAALPLLSAAMVSSGGKLGGLRGWVRAAWGPTLAALLLIYAAGLYYLVLGWPGLGYAAHIEILPVGWRDLSRQILAAAQDSQRRSGEFPVIVGMDRYAIASEIAFQGTRLQHAAPLTSSAHLFQGVGLMYELWTPPATLAGRTLLLVAFDANDLSGPFVEPRAGRLGPIETIALERDGKPIRDMYYRFAYDYRP
jgi:dolichol-phosphate mannosyltransferase